MPDLELILARSFAAHLAVAAFLSDPTGRIVYFNEAAELLIGRDYEDTPELGSEDLRMLLDPRRPDGEPVNAEDMALPVALATHLPATLRATSGRDGGMQYTATAFPFLGRDGDTIGALLFWYEEKT